MVLIFQAEEVALWQAPIKLGRKWRIRFCLSLMIPLLIFQRRFLQDIQDELAIKLSQNCILSKDFDLQQLRQPFCATVSDLLDIASEGCSWPLDRSMWRSCQAFQSWSLSSSLINDQTYCGLDYRISKDAHPRIEEDTTGGCISKDWSRHSKHFRYSKEIQTERTSDSNIRSSS